MWVPILFSYHNQVRNQHCLLLYCTCHKYMHFSLSNIIQNTCLTHVTTASKWVSIYSLFCEATSTIKKVIADWLFISCVLSSCQATCRWDYRCVRIGSPESSVMTPPSWTLIPYSSGSNVCSLNWDRLKSSRLLPHNSTLCEMDWCHIHSELRQKEHCLSEILAEFNTSIF